MADFLSRLARGLGRGVEIAGTLGTADLFRERMANERRQLGNILSEQSIPTFARAGGAEPDSPENIRKAQLGQLANLGTPEALDILGKLSPMNQSPEKMKALGYLSSVISQRFGLPAEQVNAMLMGGVEPSALGTLLKPETPELVQTYDPSTGQMVYTPKSQAVGKIASAPDVKDRKIIEQDGIQYYADSGEPVIASPIKPAGKGDYKEGELSAANFANRMVGASDMLREVENMEGFNPISGEATFAGLFGRTAERLASTPELQRYKNAAQDWIRAKLRKESGAVIGDDEMRSEYETYFPVYGDSPSVIAQKEKLRQRATEGMIKSSQGAFSELYGSITPDEALQELKRRGKI